MIGRGTFRKQFMSETYVDKPVPFESILKWYSVRYYCANCGHYGFVCFKKGFQKHSILCTKCECEVNPMTNSEQVEVWKQELRNELERSTAFSKRSKELCDFGLKCISMAVSVIFILLTICLEYFIITRGY